MPLPLQGSRSLLQIVPQPKADLDHRSTIPIPACGLHCCLSIWQLLLLASFFIAHLLLRTLEILDTHFPRLLWLSVSMTLFDQENDSKIVSFISLVPGGASGKYVLPWKKVQGCEEARFLPTYGCHHVKRLCAERRWGLLRGTQ